MIENPEEIYSFDTVRDALTYCDWTSRFGSSIEMRLLFRSLGNVIRSLAAKVESQAMEMEHAEARSEVMKINELIGRVEKWAEDRKIIPNSTPMAQLLKTMSELGELADATLKGDEEGIVDGVGDVLVTLIIYSRLQGVDIENALAVAYEEIKDRKGTLTPEGVFVKSE